ncbi:NTP transferase domain-containing protein [Fictibacillus sp. KIGAM418]|uniref:NTP transferase domain-containing protein n=1 Tax=Fictibacillus marinisediminis TaxID=2878389 RepID=A0A9X2BF19_9BACL|nr:sugar phosphate nucleotidyltransferase [Fictibacillus marinisediminis]MCK6259449.1 NTP transferase domain-containing protein [Fictibacillus marinisediminis]
MNIVIPLAGNGERFKKEGYTTPKILVDVMGFPMFYWALRSIKPLLKKSSPIFVCLREHLKTTDLKRKIYEYCPNATIIECNTPTNGQAESVLQAQLFLDENKPLLIFNGDTFQMAPNLEKSIMDADEKGVVFTFKSENTAYSYVEMDQDLIVKRIKEKAVISTNASTGLYYFTQTKRFIDYTIQRLEQRETNNEIYISHVIQDLISNGDVFLGSEVETCFPLGTPTELKNFLDEGVYSV